MVGYIIITLLAKIWTKSKVSRFLLAYPVVIKLIGMGLHSFASYRESCPRQTGTKISVLALLQAADVQYGRQKVHSNTGLHK